MRKQMPLATAAGVLEVGRLSQVEDELADEILVPRRLAMDQARQQRKFGRGVDEHAAVENRAAKTIPPGHRRPPAAGPRAWRRGGGWRCGTSRAIPGRAAPGRRRSAPPWTGSEDKASAWPRPIRRGWCRCPWRGSPGRERASSPPSRDVSAGPILPPLHFSYSSVYSFSAATVARAGHDFNLSADFHLTSRPDGLPV